MAELLVTVKTVDLGGKVVGRIWFHRIGYSVSLHSAIYPMITVEMVELDWLRW